MNPNTLPASDPYTVLGIGRNADDEQIRAAYVAKLKQFPPDRSPAEFEVVRDAYNLLRDRRSRAQHMLFSIDIEAPLQSLLEGPANERRFAGPAPWLAVLKDR
jgi:curved DNA-binding protein CbpA